MLRNEQALAHDIGKKGAGESSRGGIQASGESMSSPDLSPKESLAVARLKTLEECEQFAVNFASNSALVMATRKRAIEINLAAHANESQVSRDVWAVLYAYEEVLYIKHGRRLKANHTRRAIARHGLIRAVENIVTQRVSDDDGFARLVSAGLRGMTFEAVVLKHPGAFSPKAVEQARSKLESRVDRGRGV